MNRRHFLKTAAIGMTSLAVVPLLTNRAFAEQPAAVAPADFLKFKSGKSAFAPLPGHFHFIQLPEAALRSPPAEGIKMISTTAYGHHHAVVLTRDQLVQISQGQVVVVADTVHDHKYQLSLHTNV